MSKIVLQPRLFIGLGLVAALAGCAGTTKRDTNGADEVTTASSATMPTSAPTVASLQARAERRWQLLINGQPELAYDFLSPGYRQTRDREEYAQVTRDKPVKWVGVDYQDQDCDAEVCKVRLMITYSLDMPVQMVGKVESVDFVTENWLWIDGDWFYLPVTDPQKDLR